ncbi:MAG TPA: hypothetical protein VFU63_09200 [Ktedonobacterales bacterium]|nr:hypothetical protein [Ktedonobacterales bacterium]
MRMVWQDMSPFPTPRMDAEEEREMRLAAQARAGAEWALAALVARYQPSVLRYLTRLTGSPNQAYIIAERIFVRMERRLRGPHGGAHLRLWLLRASTESGLDVLRHPRRSRQQTQLNAPAGPRGLLMEGFPGAASDRLRAGLNKIVELTGSTRRQVRQLIWSADAPPATDQVARARLTAPPAAEGDLPASDPELDSMTPQEELRHRLVRAVLAELPYGDAQCLALHLIAGLNQTEVAWALGIRPSAARHRIVQGLQIFAHRYDSAITSLGVPAEIAYGEPTESLSASAARTLDARDEVYSAPAAPLPSTQQPVYSDDAERDIVSDADSDEADVVSDAEPQGYESAFPEVYDDEYDLAEVISAPVVYAPIAEEPTSAPFIVDALPVTPPETQMSSQDVPDEVDDYWPDQPTMVPILSLELPDASSEMQSATVDDVSDGATATRGPADAASSVPVLTPPDRP